MTTRLLALVLAFIIGSPVCWCCAQSAVPAPQKAKRTCCERRAAQETPSNPAPKKDSCPCGSSMIKREMAKTIIDIPPASLAATELFPVFHQIFILPVLPTPGTQLFNDTGPPHERQPLFILQHALLM